jgi:hypothetical protein
MFSAETLVNMSDGTKKHINLITVGNIVMNKLLKPVKVSRVHTLTNQQIVSILLDNGTSLFHCAPTTKFLSHTLNVDSSHSTGFLPITTIHSNRSLLKKSNKLLSTESDVSISTYDDTNNILLYSYNR